MTPIERARSIVPVTGYHFRGVGRAAEDRRLRRLITRHIREAIAEASKSIDVATECLAAAVLERDEARGELLQVTAERDAALAELEARENEQ